MARDMWVSRREFETFKQESSRDRSSLQEEVRTTAEEVRLLRRDLRLIAKLGGGLLTLVGLLGPTIVGIISLFHHP